MYRRDLTAEQLEQIGKPFIIVSQGAMLHVAKNAPDKSFFGLLVELQSLINFRTFTLVSARDLARALRCNQGRVLAGMRWLEEAGLIESEEANGETFWRFTEAFGYEGTPEKWAVLKQLQDAN